jgi:hypothetical protein
VVDAVVVVEAHVGVELAAQAGEAREELSREGRSPALVEDRLVQRLDVAVGLRAPGVRVWRAPSRASFSRRSSEATRLGPSLGSAIENETMRSFIHLRQLVGHLRPAALARAEYLQPVAVAPALRGVGGRAKRP